MKKNLKSKLKILLAALLVIGMLSYPAFSIVHAVNSFEIGEGVTVYAAKSCGKLLKYDGVEIEAIMIEYEKDGVKYPAYPLRTGYTGAEENPYEVYYKYNVTATVVWNMFKNGYPNKTLEQLGVDTVEEAYTATMYAIYCYYGNDISKYEAIDENGENTLKAMHNIVDNAYSATSGYTGGNLEVVDISNEWKQDSKDSKYISKEYKVEADADFDKYVVSIKESNVDAKVVDMNNTEISEFTANQNFKVLIPVEQTTTQNSIEFEVKSDLKTYPIIYTRSGDSLDKPYGLIYDIYETATLSVVEQINEYYSKLTIKNLDSDTNEPLEGTGFQLLNSEKEVVKNLIETNQNGNIIIKNLMQGTYYIREISSLEGYKTFNEDMEIEIKYNEEEIILIYSDKIVVEEPEEEVFEETLEESKEEVLEESNQEVIEPQKTETSTIVIEETELVKLPIAGK